LTGLAGKRDGRETADAGIEELSKAWVCGKIGLAISPIESLAFRTTFNPVKKLISLA
jgi:repressor of nif and glnA expression